MLQLGIKISACILSASPPVQTHRLSICTALPWWVSEGQGAGTYQALLLLEVGAQAEAHAARGLSVDDAPLEQAALLGAQARVVGVAVEHHRAPVLLLMPCAVKGIHEDVSRGCSTG